MVKGNQIRDRSKKWMEVMGTRGIGEKMVRDPSITIKLRSSQLV